MLESLFNEDPSSNIVSNNSSIYYTCICQNTRGLRTKTSNFYVSVCSMNFSIICLTEPRLSKDILNSELFPENITVYRADRKFVARDKTRGGGVLIAHKDYISSHEILLNAYDIPPEIDIVCISLHHIAKRIYLIVLYIPPNVCKSSYDTFLENLCNFPSELRGDIIVMGDFNTPHLENPCDPRSRSLHNFDDFCNLKQVNSIRNSSNRLLDLVFTSLE